MMKNKKVIITGVTGQDGSLMADYLLKNTEVTVIGAVRRLSVKNHLNIEHLEGNPRFTLVDLDVTDLHNIDRVVSEHMPDFFINFAANSFVGSSWQMPYNHMETNCIAVLHQLEAIRKHAPHCRYYNAGSSEEFGDVVTTPQSEHHPLRPRSPYGVSKCSARHLVKVYRESYRLYAVQGWLFNHEGVRRGEEFVTRKITKNVARITGEYRSGGGPTPLELGNLDAQRDWSDAEDFVRGVWKMLNQESSECRGLAAPPSEQEEASWYSALINEYVLSSNETHTIREFVEVAFKCAGFSPEDCRWEGEGENEKYYYRDVCIVKINPIFYRPAEVQLLLGDSSKAREELGWMPETNFLQLVEKMVLNDLDQKG